MRRAQTVNKVRKKTYHEHLNPHLLCLCSSRQIEVLCDQDLSGAELNLPFSGANSQRSIGAGHYQRKAILPVSGRPAVSVGKIIRLYLKRELTIQRFIKSAFFPRMTSI